jgi:DNA-binding MarR family transcriptional regulator
MRAAPDFKDRRSARGPTGDRVDSALMMTAMAIRRAYDAALGERLDLTFHEADILAQLSDARSLTQVELARRVGVSPARIGVHIDALAAKEAVKRVADPDDRRVWKVSLTRRGRSLWKQTVAVNRTVRASVHAGLTDQDLDVLGRLLVSLQENLDVVTDDGG